MHDHDKSYCFTKSKKEIKVDEPNYYEKFYQQELPVLIKSEKKQKTKVNKSKVNLSHILGKSDNECTNTNENKEETKIKRKSGSKGLIDTVSDSFENKKALKKSKKRKSSCQKIQCETEASDQDAKDKISYEYAKQRKKSKKKSKKEIKKKHRSHSKQGEILNLSTIQKVRSQVEEESETINKSATNSSGLTCTVVDNTPIESNNHKKKKRKHSDPEKNSETPSASNILKKRKHKHGEAVTDDKTTSASNYHKKRKHTHSEDEKGNENNLNVEEDVSISFSKHNKKKKTHRKSHTL